MLSERRRWSPGASECEFWRKREFHFYVAIVGINGTVPVVGFESCVNVCVVKGRHAEGGGFSFGGLGEIRSRQEVLYFFEALNDKGKMIPVLIALEHDKCSIFDCINGLVQYCVRSFDERQ